MILNLISSAENVSGPVNVDSNNTAKLLSKAFNEIEEAILLVVRIDEQNDEVLDYKHLNILDKQVKRSNAILKKFS